MIYTVYYNDANGQSARDYVDAEFFKTDGHLVSFVGCINDNFTRTEIVAYNLDRVTKITIHEVEDVGDKA